MRESQRQYFGGAQSISVAWSYISRCRYDLHHLSLEAVSVIDKSNAGTFNKIISI